MEKKYRSVLYAGSLQFTVPGLGRLYLKDWETGVLQFLTSAIGLGIIWSWIDGYSMIKHQHDLRSEKVDLIYHDINSKKADLLVQYQDPLIQKKSPIAASILQLFFPGLGKIYAGFKIIGFIQLGLSLLIYFGIFLLILKAFYPYFFDQILSFEDLFNLHLFYALMLTSSIILIIRFILWQLFIFDNYTLLKKYELNGNKTSLHFFLEPVSRGNISSLVLHIGYKEPLEFSKIRRVMKMKVGSRDRLVGGILQIFLPGLGRFYLGYRLMGVLQLLSSLILLGVIWSWIDGHHILLNPDVDKDGQDNPLTDQYRL